MREGMAIYFISLCLHLHSYPIEYQNQLFPTTVMVLTHVLDALKRSRLLTLHTFECFKNRKCIQQILGIIMVISKFRLELMQILPEVNKYLTSRPALQYLLTFESLQPPLPL